MNVNEFILRRAMNKVADDGNWFKNKYEQATDWLAEKLLGEDGRKRRDILEADKPVTFGSKLPVYQDGKIVGSRNIFNTPDLRTHKIHQAQKNIDAARDALETNNGLLHPVKERQYSKDFKKAINDAWDLKDTLNNSENIDFSNMPYVEAVKKYPAGMGFGNALDPNSHIATTLAKYYPELSIVPSDIEGLHAIEATYPEWYKASYTNKEVADEVFRLSQQARKEAKVKPEHGYYPMGSWFYKDGVMDELPEYLLNKTDKHRMLLYDMPLMNDNVGWWQHTKDLARLRQIKSGDDRASRAAAAVIGPHVSLKGGAIPEGANFKLTQFVTDQLGLSANLRDLAGHEFQHIPTNTIFGPSDSTLNRLHQYNGAGPAWSTNNRDFYSMDPAEADRTLHGIKAISSDLMGKPITNFDEAIKVLKDNKLLDYNDKGEASFNYDVYNTLLNEGKIKPTDPSMIIDLLNLDSNMRDTWYVGSMSAFPQYSDWVYQYGVDPRTGEPLNKDNQSTMRFDKMWKKMMQHRFEMAQLNKNKGYRPGLGYSMNTMNGIPT